jgi:hypothetical protein
MRPRGEGQLRLTGGARVRSCARKIEERVYETSTLAAEREAVDAGTAGPDDRGAEKCVRS